MARNKICVADFGNSKVIFGGDKKYSEEKILSSLKSTFFSRPIEINYDKFVNIKMIDKQIKKRLEQKIELKDLEDKLLTLEYREIIENSKIKENQRSKEEFETDQKKIEEIRREIEFVRSGGKLKKYIDESSGLVDEFSSTEYSNTSPEYATLVREYSNVASKYADIIFHDRKFKQSESCSLCFIDLTKIYANELGEKKCPECETLTKFEKNLTKKDKKSMRKKDILATIKKEIIQFQGKEKIDINKEIYDTLDEYFIYSGVGSSEEIKMRPVDRYGKTEGTSLQMLLGGLSECKFSPLYKHANLIGKNLWGWKLHDLTDKMEEIEKDLLLTQKEYDKISGDRSSNISSSLRLYKHLKRAGVDVCPEDFKFTSSASRRKSELLWKKMVESTETEKDDKKEKSGMIITRRSKLSV